MNSYPKIQTLYKRDENFKATGTLYLAEYGLIPLWHVTEKIHGTNIRIHWDGERVTCASRKSENPSDIPGDLLRFLRDTFTAQLMTEIFGALGDENNPTSFDHVTIFGEGCGPGIQKGGANYSKTKTFILFDVLVGSYWLEPENITDVARKCGVQEAPFLGMLTLAQITRLVRDGYSSPLAAANTGSVHPAEGIIARTVPGLFTRYGTRLMFKLKTDDFAIAEKVA